MQRKISVSKNVFFLIKSTKERLFSEDDVIVRIYIVVYGEKYFLQKESYMYEISQVLKYLSESSNILETESDDLGYENFLSLIEFEKALTSGTEFSQDPDIGYYYSAFFNNNIDVLFYKKASKIYCQVTENDLNKGYKSLCIEEVTVATLEKWKKKLPDKFI